MRWQKPLPFEAGHIIRVLCGGTTSPFDRHVGGLFSSVLSNIGQFCPSQPSCKVNCGAFRMPIIDVEKARQLPR